MIDLCKNVFPISFVISYSKNNYDLSDFDNFIENVIVFIWHTTNALALQSIILNKWEFGREKRQL